MGLINRLFGGTTEALDSGKFHWIPLTNSEQLDIIESRSKVKVQVIFKYSTRCGINRIVMKGFEKANESSEQDFDFYFLDILSFRSVSNTITTRFEVIHESPQVLVIKKGVVVAHASHSEINRLDLNVFIID
jgi:bacillithiol system protein YtxJ